MPYAAASPLGHRVAPRARPPRRGAVQVGGFAVGRTIWWDAVAAHLAGELDREAATGAIADRYLHFAEVYRAAK